MPSKTEIANLALTHLGISKRISDIDVERSNEANLCKQVYDTSRKIVLEECPWPFAVKIAAGQLITTDPNNEWIYSYQYPSDCLRLTKIQSGLRNDNRQSRVEYRVAQGTTGQIIFTNVQNAILEYTINQEDPTIFSASFTMALGYLMASFIAPTITSPGDPFKLGDRCLAGYMKTIAAAKSKAFNEEQPAQTPDSEFIRAREYTSWPPPDRIPGNP